ETESYRRMVWEDNWRFIEQHNQEHAAGKHSYKLGMNHFGDLTDQEFNKMNGFHPDPALRKLPVFNSTGSPVPPKSIDWRVKGYVTRVKNQGACASCWAFSATGALEGQHFKKTRQLVSLSEQNLVDCTNNEEYGNSGCNNGFMNTSFEYVKKNGIASEESYPYRAKDGPCTTNARKVANCSGYTAVKKSERALQDAVASIGPVSVAIDASHCSFQFYKSVYQNVLTTRTCSIKSRLGSCGSCWAFSATGAVEGQHFKKTRRLVSLSEQNLVECTKNRKYMNYGCNGGLMGRAFQYIIDNRGIASEQRYPYTGKDNKPCRYSASMKAARVSSYWRVPRRNEKALRDAVVAIGPISTCLNAGRRTFQFYRSGIYYDPKCGQRINHAVLAVGYGVSWFGSGSSRPTKFWLLKNRIAVKVAQKRDPALNTSLAQQTLLNLNGSSTTSSSPIPAPPLP
ncbi:Cathepsin L1, partial [Acipenser ruthenus]